MQRVDRLFRQESDEGFTLIELLVVLVIVGVLLAIAVPSYLGFSDRANKAAARANVRTGVPAVEAYYSDKDTYAGVTVTKLKASYATGLLLTTIKSQSQNQYCIEAVSGNQTAHRTGPVGAVTLNGSC